MIKKYDFQTAALTIFLYLLICASELAAHEVERSLITDHMLHPLDSYTAYTFHKGEMSYNLPLPVIAISPGWMWWGITDWLTAELDLECWLGGVPSFNFRFGLIDQHGIQPALAYETMYQYLPREINLLEEYDSLNIIRRGNSWYNRINATWLLLKRIRLHLSAGATYSEYLLIENNNRPQYYGRLYQHLIDPDISLGIDWRFAGWLSFHATGSYGTTFVYVDNVPRKYQFCYGFRVAPFYRSRWGILRNFGIEIASLIFHFREAKETVSVPLPIYPFLYWQWRW